LCFLENNAPNPSVTNPRIIEGSGTDWIDLVATCKLSIEKSPLPPTGDISIRDAGIDVTIPKNLNEFGLRLLPETVACSIRLLEASKADNCSVSSPPVLKKPTPTIPLEGFIGWNTILPLPGKLQALLLTRALGELKVGPGQLTKIEWGASHLCNK